MVVLVAMAVVMSVVVVRGLGERDKQMEREYEGERQREKRMYEQKEECEEKQRPLNKTSDHNKDTHLGPPLWYSGMDSHKLLHVSNGMRIHSSRQPSIPDGFVDQATATDGNKSRVDGLCGVKLAIDHLKSQKNPKNNNDNNKTREKK